jgi:hypothetical protein
MAEEKLKIINTIIKAKLSVSKKDKLFTKNDINLEIRNNLLKTYVWNIML